MHDIDNNFPIKFTVKHVRYFVAVGRTGSVTKAAQTLNVSQPSISAAIAHLEQVFGIQLFIRHHAQGLSLTPSGRQLFVEAQQFLSNARDLQQLGVELNGRLTGRLDIGCFPTAGPAYMPSRIKGFAVEQPDVTVVLHEGHQEFLLNGLTNGRFEIAITYDLHIDQAVVFEPLLTLPAYVIVSEDHRFAERASLDLAELVDEPLILLDLPLSRDYFLSLFFNAGLRPKIAYQTTSLEMVRGLVANGLGFSLLNSRVAMTLAPDGKPYRCIPLENDPPALRLGIVRLSEAKLTRKAASFVDFCRSSIGDEEIRA
ncbi:LysR family transcriptional regulator [Oceanibacterium hippocampi]|uniref:Hydrogen peroxide-inducible genes activator n=1 Tax=Oceanibacterium hippocampi TaxID=745714 RepID=A0A1Y5TI20_9PROT|nr:LysR family transcriptional regulator [Oceanibacterium hippocampi]SLN64384.1 Hydrogen peroxide-inducible genes activator [Oceanibacterium hippocampi]